MIITYPNIYFFLLYDNRFNWLSIPLLYCWIFGHLQKSIQKGCFWKIGQKKKCVFWKNTFFYRKVM